MCKVMIMLHVACIRLGTTVEILTLTQSIQVHELGEQQLADTSGFQKNSSAILEAPGVLKKNKLQTKKKGVPCRQSRGSLNANDCSGSPRCAKKTLTPPPVMVPWYCQQKTVLYWDLGDLILEQPMIYYLCRDGNASSGSHIILTTQNACHLF